MTDRRLERIERMTPLRAALIRTGIVVALLALALESWHDHLCH